LNWGARGSHPIFGGGNFPNFLKGGRIAPPKKIFRRPTFNTPKGALKEISFRPGEFLGQGRGFTPGRNWLFYKSPFIFGINWFWRVSFSLKKGEKKRGGNPLFLKGAG